MKPCIDLLLVSGSPRRRELLDMIGVQFDVFDADIDEARRDGEEPEAYVSRLALEKAQAGLRDYPGGPGEGCPTLGADTIVLADGEILGKPADRATARAMLRRLSDATHHVLSAVAVITPEGEVIQALNRTTVTFGAVPESWIVAYADTAEPMDKAGAYAIQGHAAQWVRSIEGSYSGVMGLPLFETAELLRRAGVPVLF